MEETYHITDELTVAYEYPVLEFDLNDTTISGIDDDFAANLLNELIGIVFNPTTAATREKLTYKQPDGAEMSISFTGDPACKGGFKIDIVIYTGTEISQIVTLNERWQFVKLMNILTHLLPKMCEERP
jgi:hypothetical protein